MKNAARRKKFNVINFPAKVPDDPRPYTADDLTGWLRVPDPKPHVTHWLSGDTYYNFRTGEMKLVGPSGETKYSGKFEVAPDDPRPYMDDKGVIDLDGWLTGGNTGYMVLYNTAIGEAKVVGPSGETVWIIQRVMAKEAA